MTEAVASEHGGRRKGAGRPTGSTAVALDVRERLVTARAAREQIAAQILAIELQRARGDVVPAAAATKALQRAGMAFRDAMLSIPGRYASQLLDR